MTRRIEYDPVEKHPITKNAEKIEKLVLATHTCHPVYCITLLPSRQPTSPKENDRPHLDLFASCAGGGLVCCVDFLQKGLTSPGPVPGTSGVSCVNCMMVEVWWRRER